MANTETVSRADWLAARKAHLKAEKEFDRARDALSAARRALPRVEIDKPYEFEGPDGTLALGDLFGPHSQLIIYHFMFAPDWDAGCKSCSFIADHFDAMLPHLAARDTALVAVSRAPLKTLRAYAKRLGWRFPWVSSEASDFNRDFHVSFTETERDAKTCTYNYEEGVGFPSEEAPGASVFLKDTAGAIFHTYSTYGRGLDKLIGCYHYLDMTPNGRDEDDLDFTMAWVRRHDEY